MTSLMHEAIKTHTVGAMSSTCTSLRKVTGSLHYNLICYNKLQCTEPTMYVQT